MIDTTDAMESARTILLGLNMDWISKQGDFFVESPINFVTAPGLVPAHHYENQGVTAPGPM